MSVLSYGQLCATIEIKKMYLRPAGHADLECRTRVLKQGKRIGFMESERYSGEDLTAKASGSFAIV